MDQDRFHKTYTEASDPCYMVMSDFVESLSGSDNDVDVEKIVDVVNGEVGQRVTGNVDNQNIDFDKLVLLPLTFADFNTDAIMMKLRCSDNTGNNKVEVHVFGTDGIEVGAGFDLTPSITDTWEEKTISADQLLGGVFTAGQAFRIRAHVIADNGDTVDLGCGCVRYA